MQLWPFPCSGGGSVVQRSTGSLRRLLNPSNLTGSLRRHHGSITVAGKTYQDDEYSNVTDRILKDTARQLHTQSDHPLSIIRQIIESCFPSTQYRYYNNLHPVVSCFDNFDSLGFPADHPARSRRDTFYVNRDHVLRTHTSAHQADLFRHNPSDGFLTTADVYRRDSIDRTHFPIFHQTEGARLWDRDGQEPSAIADAIAASTAELAIHQMVVHDPDPHTHPERNPVQRPHSLVEAEAVAGHLKKTLENMIHHLFIVGGLSSTPPEIRWVEAFFPFTSPSFELEVMHQGEWLEVLGCGVIAQPLLENAAKPHSIGWAFGLGLERLAMLLFAIPDIRLFWSQDPRFLSQFSADTAKLRKFVPFSEYPPRPMDLAFWLPAAPRQSDNADERQSSGGRLRVDPSPTAGFHENDFMAIVRELGGEIVEVVQLVDSFEHPKTGRRSLCYRIVYRGLERELDKDEVNELHKLIAQAVGDALQVTLR